MMAHTIWVAHIVVLGYWLGAEFVINRAFREVAYGSDQELATRRHWMDVVMDVDQHVRYALVLQLSLGGWLAMDRGWLPGGLPAQWALVGFSLAWIALIEVVHRRRKASNHAGLARLDRGVRYCFMGLLVALGVQGLLASFVQPAWFSWKLVVFASVMACGVGIRWILIRYFHSWSLLKNSPDGPDISTIEQELRWAYRHATAMLGLLWFMIGIVTWLSIAKPFP